MQTKEKIIRCARKVLNHDGYQGATLKKITQEANIQKGGIYYYFQNKEMLGCEVIKRSGEEFLKFLNRVSTGKTAAEKIRNQFIAILNYHKNDQCKLGCIFGNSALEMSNRSEKIRKSIESIFEKWERINQNLLEEAETEGSLRSELGNEVEKLSKTIVAAIEGGIMLTKTGRDYHHLETVLNSIISLIFKNTFIKNNSI